MRGRGEDLHQDEVDQQAQGIVLKTHHDIDIKNESIEAIEEVLLTHLHLLHHPDTIQDEIERDEDLPLPLETEEEIETTMKSIRILQVRTETKYLVKNSGMDFNGLTELIQHRERA